MNSQESTFENKISQITAHTAKIQIVVISRFLIANIIVSYIHSNTSMKLPDIQGNIIAQIAIAPQIKVHHHVDVIESGVFVGAVIKNANIQNIIKQATHFQFHLTCFHKSIEDINISQKKKDQIKIG